MRPGDSAFDFAGHAVHGAGDVNKDGHADFLVGIPDDDDTGKNAGSARLYSGKTGKRIFHWNGDATTDNFGHSVCTIGDVDKDGWLDIAVGAPQFTLGTLGKGYVRIFSGKTGKAIKTLRGAALGDWYGEPVRPAGDFNSDGVPDLLIGSYQNDAAGSNAGKFEVVSGKDWSTIEAYSGKAGDGFGFALCFDEDIDDDGRKDFIVGAPDGGYAKVLAGKKKSLVGDVHEFSLTGLGPQTLSLDAGKANAGRFYLIVGTASGRKPGVLLFGKLLQINIDAYTNILLANANTIIRPSIGLLDKDGRASAKFALLKGMPPGLAGLRLDHAFVYADAKTGIIKGVSNPVPLRLVQ